jgi:hypothetical protein
MVKALSNIASSSRVHSTLKDFLLLTFPKHHEKQLEYVATMKHNLTFRAYDEKIFELL